MNQANQHQKNYDFSWEALIFLQETEERKITNFRKPLFFHTDPANQHEKKTGKMLGNPYFFTGNGRKQF
jgi:hypothetical protein